MKVSILSENTGKTEQFLQEHGLSIFIETKSKKILFDFGRSDKFIQNANKLGVDLEQVDLAILSHGHYDHGDGLLQFLKLNKKAPIYLQTEAFASYYSGTTESGKEPTIEEVHYIGVKQEIKEQFQNNRFCFVEREKKIEDNLTLYGKICAEKFVPSINRSLYMQQGTHIVCDTFGHELNLLLEEDGKYYLFAGCAHNGIVNIVEQIEKRSGISIDVVFAGFHLHTPKKGNQVSEQSVIELANYLQNMNPIFYTGHCTGIEEYTQMKTILGNKLHYMSAGSVFSF